MWENPLVRSVESFYGKTTALRSFRKGGGTYCKSSNVVGDTAHERLALRASLRTYYKHVYEAEFIFTVEFFFDSERISCMFTPGLASSPHLNSMQVAYFFLLAALISDLHLETSSFYMCDAYAVYVPRNACPWKS